MGKIILVTGGQRCGKSEFAEKLALQLSERPIYIATAYPGDEEFRQRIIRHQLRRGKQWTTIEEEIYLSRHNVASRTALIDCVTLWATNVFFSKEEKVTESLTMLRDEFDKFTSQDATFIFVTNEIGLGGVSENAMTRHFTDLLGWFNQYIAAHADEVYMLLSGIPVKIK